MGLSQLQLPSQLRPPTFAIDLSFLSEVRHMVRRIQTRILKAHNNDIVLMNAEYLDNHSSLANHSNVPRNI